MGKDMKITHSVSSPQKFEGTFSRKKLCMREQIFFSNFIAECLTCGLIIRSCKGESSWLGGCKGRVKLVFLSLILTWVIDMLFEKLTPRIEKQGTENIFCTLCLWGWEFQVKQVFFFKKYLVVTCFLISWL